MALFDAVRFFDAVEQHDGLDRISGLNDGAPKPPGASAQAYPADRTSWLPPGLAGLEFFASQGLLAFGGANENADDTIGEAELLNNFNKGLADSAQLNPDGVQPNQLDGVDLDWFERWLVIPGSLDFGNVLATQLRDLEVVNNFRKFAHDWLTFDNNVIGGGVTVDNVPSLPTTVNALQAILLEVTVGTQGPPTIQGSLDFTFDVTAIEVEVTGQRIVLFPFQPEAELEERLEFLTEVLLHADGSEQRIRLRNGPRQIVVQRIFQEDDVERDNLHSLLFETQARVYGIPIWWEQRQLDADFPATSSTIQVDTTFADFRVGGLVLVWGDWNDFEVFEIEVVNAGSLEIVGESSRGWTVEERPIVMPARQAVAEERVSQERHLTGPTRTTIRFTTLDNTDVADAGAFGSYKGRVLVDRFNASRGLKSEGSLRAIERVDDEISPIAQTSSWLKSKPELALRLVSNESQQEVWEIRQLLHLLGGRQVAFFLPTARRDLRLTQPVGDGSNALQIEWVNYTNFYESTSPRNEIQIVRKDGTKSQHEITGSSIVTENVEESLTITPGVSPALAIEDVERIEFLTLSRLGADRVTIVHRRPGQATVDAPTVGVLGQN